MINNITAQKESLEKLNNVERVTNRQDFSLLRGMKRDIVKIIEATIVFLGFIIIFGKKVYASELTPEENLVYSYVDEVTDSYGISTGFIMAVIEKESCYVPNVSNGRCIGLMQINPSFQKERMQRLGCDNLYDWKQNILVGTDYIYELFQTYEDPALVLMIYNMKHDSAMRLYNQGKISNYAMTILERALEFDEAVERGVSSYASSQI